jgi:small subunit ribosomal protein S6
MRPYETLVVLSNELGGGKEPLVERCREIIKTQGGVVDNSHDWGSRKLAYPIAKQSEGHYFLLEYQAPPEAVSELERTLRIADGVLRYMSVQQDHTGLPPDRAVEAPGREDRPLHEMRSYDRRGPRGEGGRPERPPRDADRVDVGSEGAKNNE